MRKILYILAGIFAILLFTATAEAQPALTQCPTVNLDRVIQWEYYDTVTVDSIDTKTFPAQLWYVEVGLFDTTQVETVYIRPNSSRVADLGAARGTSSARQVTIRLLGAHPNKFLLPQTFTWGPLAISSLTYYCWYGGSGANAGDSVSKIWIRGFTIPTGYNR